MLSASTRLEISITLTLKTMTMIVFDWHCVAVSTTNDLCRFSRAKGRQSRTHGPAREFRNCMVPHEAFLMSRDFPTIWRTSRTSRTRGISKERVKKISMLGGPKASMIPNFLWHCAIKSEGVPVTLGWCQNVQDKQTRPMSEKKMQRMLQEREMQPNGCNMNRNEKHAFQFSTLFIFF